MPYDASDVRLAKAPDGTVVLAIGGVSAVMTIGEWSQIISHPDRASTDCGPLKSVVRPVLPVPGSPEAYELELACAKAGRRSPYSGLAFEGREL